MGRLGGIFEGVGVDDDLYSCILLCHAYISSHSPSSSSSLGGGGGAFSFTKSFRSRGHVAWSFSHGAMHSRSKIWFLLQGRRTTRGYSSTYILSMVNAVGTLGEIYLQEKDYRISDNPYPASTTSLVLYPALNPPIHHQPSITILPLIKPPPPPCLPQ